MFERIILVILANQAPVRKVCNTAVGKTDLTMMCYLHYKFQFDITLNTETELIRRKIISICFLFILMEH